MSAEENVAGRGDEEDFPERTLVVSNDEHMVLKRDVKIVGGGDRGRGRRGRRGGRVGGSGR